MHKVIFSFSFILLHCQPRIYSNVGNNNTEENNEYSFAEYVKKNPQIKTAKTGNSSGNDCRFPLSKDPDENFTEEPRSFGAYRSGGRLHAGCDLMSPDGTPIYAVCDGEILDFYYFYDDTYALEVKHNNFVVRYGELSASSPVKAGQRVKKGDLIGHVGYLVSLGLSMLHFEIYTGKATGLLSASGNDYSRRSDLTDCTPYLKKWIAFK